MRKAFRPAQAVVERYMAALVVERSLLTTARAGRSPRVVLLDLTASVEQVRPLHQACLRAAVAAAVVVAPAILLLLRAASVASPAVVAVLADVPVTIPQAVLLVPPAASMSPPLTRKE